MVRSAVLVVTAWVAVSGCYRPDLDVCAVSCATDSTCPDGWTCEDDLHCHPPGEPADCPLDQPNSGYTALGAGVEHACAVDSDGALWCWGQNHQGQLGVDVGEVTGTPTKVSDAGWSAVAGGSNHTCGIQAGHMLCWGRNDYGQTAATTGAQATPTEVPGGAVDWIAVAVGDDHSCGIRGDGDQGRLYCWGKDSSLQLGDGDGDSSSATIREVGATEGTDRFPDWVEVEAGTTHTCARRAGGDTYCWGSGGSGEIGDGGWESHGLPTPVEGSFTAIAVGEAFTCGIRAPGELWCWGDDSVGELGRPGSMAAATSPVRVGARSDWTAVAAGWAFACGVHGGTVSCWGTGGVGEIGDGDYVDADVPTDVDGLAGVTALVAGNEFACALSDGNAYCWGDDRAGELGNGSFAVKRTPTRVGTATDWSTVFVAREHACGIRAGGHLFCWGDNEKGQVSDAAGRTSPTPTEILPAGDWLEVGAGHEHTCAIHGGASPTQLYCWGDNGADQVGDPGGAGVYPPHEIAHRAAGWDHLAVGVFGACALSGGARWCWGLPADGVLGNGSATAAVPVPTQVANETIAWDELAFGADFGCGRQPGEVLCWGVNGTGQQGRGTNTGGPYLTPMTTSTGQIDDVAVAWGGESACAITDGALACWGADRYGMLGDGNGSGEQDAPFPVTDPLVTTWVQVSVGAFHTCAIANDDMLFCWGSNINGQLGDPSIPYDATTPLRIDPSHAWRLVSAGYLDTCAITTDDELYCWGWNEMGVIGDGSQCWATPQRTAR